LYGSGLQTENCRIEFWYKIGRYLQVFYVPDEDSEDVFVITAYEPQGKAKKAFRRRQRKKPK
jgi:hypothetical protein